MLPLLRGKEGARGRDHVYLEMGFARGVATRKWKYIAVRYPQKQIEKIKRSKLEGLPKAMSYIGRLGIGTRGADRPGFWDGDQLYDLEADPEEMKNVSQDPKHVAILAKMRGFLRADLKSMGRPFGEFVPGGDAVPGGQIDKQIALVKTLTIKGKSVIVPGDHQPGEKPAERRKARQEARKKRQAKP